MLVFGHVRSFKPSIVFKTYIVNLADKGFITKGAHVFLR